MHRLFVLLALLASPLYSLSPRAKQLELERYATQKFLEGDFAEAEAVWRSLGAGPEWAALQFERQGYAALAELKGPKEGNLLLGRALLNLSRPSEALASLQSLSLTPTVARLRAEALEALSDTRAAAAWEEAARFVTRTPEAALIHFKAGLYFASQGRASRAEEFFKAAQKFDSAYVAAHTRLAALYEAEGRTRDAKWRLDKALSVDRRDGEAKDRLSALLKENPGLKAEALKQDEKKLADFSGRTHPAVAPLAGLPNEPQLRVGLLQGVPSFRFRPGSDTRVEPLGLTLAAGLVYEASLFGKSWRLSTAGQQPLTFTSTLKLQPLDPSSSFGLFESSFGSDYFFSEKGDRYYRGSFEIVPEQFKSLSLINEIPMDAYLLGVVPSEVHFHWKPEALRAQAIAARTDTYGKRSRHSRQGFDLCAEVHCAAYKGVGLEKKSTSLAVESSRGLVLVQGPKGRLVPAIYMGACGGHTQEDKEAWAEGGDHPPFAAFDGPSKNPWSRRFPLSPASLIEYIEDPGDKVQAWCGLATDEPYAQYRWIARYEPKALERFVNQRYKVGRLLAVEPMLRGPSGYVREVRFVGDQASSISSSDYVRSAIKGLRSNFFYAETRRDAQGLPLEFLFHGAGWGHGVGLCQDGMAAMAEAGMKAEKILAHYFRESRLQKRY